ncbi:hypothetical protein [Methylocucumis oryzae]|uniref:PAS domain-containing protein n=1 Tax=Methylocucumis oryzae TaxID=1632867 RepID=A0A0F3IE63_9GAMM|nr:hypothetical protein [Methylocucumis oryzae]KJV05080.1 hypothetical protein VZ94_20765 [Methylocucumis oryzae]
MLENCSAFIVDHSSDAILVADRNGVILSANSSLFKLHNSFKKGAKLSEVIPVDYCKQILSYGISNFQALIDFNETLTIGASKLIVTKVGVTYQDEEAILLLFRNVSGYLGFFRG